MNEDMTTYSTMDIAPTDGSKRDMACPVPRARHGASIIGRSRSAVLSGLAMCLVLALGGPASVQPAHAQPSRETAETRQTTYLTVTGDQPVPLRCGSQDIWYAVVEVPPGTVLAGDQQIGSGWWSVAYPHGVPAVVPIEEGRLVQPGGPVELIEPSTLKAFNMLDPVREESFRRVLADQLEPGTGLPYIRSINARDGSVGGYLVRPPATARLWIDGGNVREATAPEIEAFRAAAEARAQRDQPEPTPEPTPEEDTTPVPAEPETDPGIEANTEEPAGQPQQPTTTDPTDEQGESTETDPTITEEEPVSPARRAAARVAALDATLQATIRAPLESAEFDELIAQYQSVASRLNAESDPDGMLAVAIEERINLLTLRSELQATRRELLAIREGQSAVNAEVQSLLEQARASRRYSVVGRLSTSTVYDGVSLPRLLRIVSIEGERGRTLAYLAPQDEQNLDARLGQIVGVIAPPPTEASQRVPILVPSEVDALDASLR